MTFRYQNVKLERVVDGDTVDLSIDMGNHITWRQNFRLNGIDAPELPTPPGDSAKQHLSSLLSGGIAMAETFKPDKFGRWLVDLYVNPEQGGQLLVNQAMITDGFAKEYHGGARG